MPKLLTPRPEWSDEIQVPADGDLADESSLRTPFSLLANGARWLRDLAVVHGVHAIRGVASLPALRSVANPTNGQVAYVYGHGIYVFLEGQAPADDAPWIIAPTGAASGRWYHPLANLLAGARSFVTTTPANKITPDLIPNGLVAVHHLNQQGGMPSMGTTPVEIVGYTLTPPNVRAGDIFHVDWQGRLQCANPGMWASFIPVIVDNNQETQLEGLEVRRSTVRGGLTDSDLHVSSVWTAQTATVAFKAKYKNSGAGEAFFDNGTIRALHFRP